MADAKQQAALAAKAFPPESKRALRAIALGSALGLLMSASARARERTNLRRA